MTVATFLTGQDGWTSYCPDCNWEDKHVYVTRVAAETAGDLHACLPPVRIWYDEGWVDYRAGSDEPVDAGYAPKRVR